MNAMLNLIKRAVGRPKGQRYSDERLRESVLANSKKDENDCWIWQRQIRPDGYGAMWIGDEKIVAHRASYMASVGEIPDGKQLHHICGKRPCVNPSHLIAVTPLEHCALDRSGDNNPSHQHPERMARGDRHSSRTHPERVARGDRNGSRVHPERLRRGENHGMAKISNAQVIELKQLSAEGASNQELADKYKVTTTTIRGILSGLYRKTG